MAQVLGKSLFEGLNAPQGFMLIPTGGLNGILEKAEMS